VSRGPQFFLGCDSILNCSAGPYRCHWCTRPYRVDLRLQLPRLLRPDWIEDFHHRSSLDQLSGHLLHPRRQHLQQDLFPCGLRLLRHGKHAARLMWRALLIFVKVNTAATTADCWCSNALAYVTS